MDQQRIGQFIAEMRKERGLTQKELAKELNVSDKTVSKWECGNGLPDVSLMLPLCEILQVSVNELLSGKRLPSHEYKENAENNLVKLMGERSQAKRSLWLGVLAVVVTFLAGITLIMISGYFEMLVWQRVALVVIGFVVIIGGIIVALVLELTSGAFECAKCGKRFMPRVRAYILAPHTPTKRLLKCPYCGEKSWCIRRMSLTVEETPPKDE